MVSRLVAADFTLTAINRDGAGINGENQSMYVRRSVWIVTLNISWQEDRQNAGLL